MGPLSILDAAKNSAECYRRVSNGGFPVVRRAAYMTAIAVPSTASSRRIHRHVPELRATYKRKRHDNARRQAFAAGYLRCSLLKDVVRRTLVMSLPTFRDHTPVIFNILLDPWTRVWCPETSVYQPRPHATQDTVVMRDFHNQPE